MEAPSGLATIAPVNSASAAGPSTGGPAGTGRCGSRTSQDRTVLSPLPPAATSRSPPAVNCTLNTASRKWARTGTGGQSRTAPSTAAVTRAGPAKRTAVTGPGWGRVVSSGRSPAVDQTRTALSEPPAASCRPSGLKASALTQLVAPVRAGRGAPSAHRCTARSAPPAASRCPSGLNATANTVLAGPVSGAPSAVRRRRSQR